MACGFPVTAPIYLYSYIYTYIVEFPIIANRMHIGWDKGLDMTTYWQICPKQSVSEGCFI